MRQRRALVMTLPITNLSSIVMAAHRVVLRVLVFAIIAAAAPDLAASRLRNGGEAQPTPVGSGRISGTLVAADDGRPIGAVAVRLIGRFDDLRPAERDATRTFSWQMDTDANGRFDITDLPAGRYAISLMPKSGFVHVDHHHEVVLAEGAAIDIPLSLARTGAIEGRVTDIAGDPVSGVSIKALRRIKVGDFETLVNGGDAATNDRGEFRVLALPAGEYHVVAVQNSHRRESDGETRWGTATTWFPGTSSVEAAQTVHVQAGRDTSAVGFTLLRSQLVTVTVAAVDSRGARLNEDAGVTLQPRSDIYLNGGLQATRTADGLFVFRDVPVGDYILGAATHDAEQEGAYESVTIGPGDMAFDLRTNIGATISGRVVLNGEAAGSAGVGHINALVSASPPPRMFGYQYFRMQVVDVKGTDRFTMSGLRGPVQLHGDAASGTQLSIMYGDRDISGETLVLSGTERIEDVVVDVTTKVASAEVKVRAAQPGAAWETVTVMVFPDDPSTWHRGHLRYGKTVNPFLSSGTARPHGGGVHVIRLPPGRYRAVAIPDIPLNAPIDFRLLAALRPLATSITLVAGEKTTVTVGVSELP